MTCRPVLANEPISSSSLLEADRLRRLRRLAGAGLAEQPDGEPEVVKRVGAGLLDVCTDSLASVWSGASK